MDITGAIFDMDGTILDSMHIWDNVGRDYLISMGKTPEDDLLKKIEVMSLTESAEYFITTYGLDLTKEEILQGVNSTIEVYYRDSLLLKDGVLEFLDYLKDNNVKMILATATDRPFVELVFKRLQLDKYFTKILTCTEVGSCKNDPLIYNTALKQLGTKKDSTYIFEDAYFAIKTAKAAGFKVVGIGDKSNESSRDDIINLSDIYINTFKEMRNYL